MCFLVHGAPLPPSRSCGAKLLCVELSVPSDPVEASMRSCVERLQCASCTVRAALCTLCELLRASCDAQPPPLLRVFAQTVASTRLR
eukprot:2533775-Pleurochrysis_carterae.AAC.2